MKHEKWIQRCYELAEFAVSKGNHPFGALLVLDDKVILESENKVVTDRDVTAHAELNLVRKASQTLNIEQLKMSILYTSTEPCAMCSGAIFWSGISQVVFGCSAKTMAKHSSGSFVVPCRHLFEFGSREMEVSGPFLEKTGESQHKSFWPSFKP